MPGPGGLLTLDLAGDVGWAYGGMKDERPDCGTWLLPSGSLGRRIAAMENELEDALVLHRPALLLVEAPLPPTARSNATTWRQQLGLAGAAEAAAYRHDVGFREQAASTMRAEILGTARFKNGDAKSAIMAHMALLGWRVPDHNAGDACVAWLYGVRHYAQAPRRIAA